MDIRGVYEDENLLVVFDPDSSDPTWTTVDGEDPVCIVLKDEDYEEATENKLNQEMAINRESIADIVDDRNRFRVALWMLVDAINKIPVDLRDVGVPLDAIGDLMYIHNTDGIGLRKPPPDTTMTEEEYDEFIEYQKKRREEAERRA
tara:strand:- start:4226 stop:4666 length:441 start_codon:yes stop_codon:yes gene_type:complete